MTLIGIISTPRLASVEAPGFNLNPSIRLSRPTCLSLIGKYANPTRIQSSNFRCSLSRQTLSPLESEENDNLTASDCEEEFGHVMKFKISDFKICDRVSSGLGGRVQKTWMYLWISLKCFKHPFFQMLSYFSVDLCCRVMRKFLKR